VLVEGPSKNALKLSDNKTEDQVDQFHELERGSGEASGEPVQMMGRTACDRIVVFEGQRRLAGQIMPLVIYEVSPFTMFGAVVTEHISPATFALQT
jgi:tRNA-2-methylthio-N6-dimethylallyladenosine synthase